MPIQNYPRFLTKASKTAQQLQTGLPIVGSDGITTDFNALKVNADGSINVNGGGGGGGTATDTNQVTQINLATIGNTYLDSINTKVATASKQDSQINLANIGNTYLDSINTKVATESKQDAQITQATNTNTKLDILNGNVAQYSEQLNQSYELYNIDANTLQTQYNTADIKLNTSPSTNTNRKISDLLDSFGGNSAADILENIDFYQRKLVVNSKWHTWCTKSFNDAGGTPVIWNLVAFGGIYPTKIIFTEIGIEINDLKDKTGTSILSQYFDANGGTVIANAGTELLSVGKTADDHFTEITTTGNCHFTAYYLIDPYIAP